MDSVRQKKYGLKKPFPLTAHLWFFVGGELAGAWNRFGGLGSQSANQVGAPTLGVTVDQGTAARFLEAQAIEWQQLLRV